MGLNMPEVELTDSDNAISKDENGTSINLGVPFSTIIIVDVGDGFYELFAPEFGIISNLARHPMDCWRECREQIESGIVNKAYELRISEEEKNDGNESDKAEEIDPDDGGGGTDLLDPDGKD